MRWDSGAFAYRSDLNQRFEQGHVTLTEALFCFI
jgi:hypothetical protein